MITEAEYKRLVAKENQYHNWLTSTGKNYSGGDNPVPEGISYPTHEESGMMQEYQWFNMPVERESWYITNVDLATRKGIIKTYHGVKLADVFLGKIYRSNFGDKRVSIHVKGLNGIAYYGTFYIGTGDSANLKALVGQGNNVRNRRRTYYGKE